MTEFDFKTKPFGHQREEFEQWNKAARGVLWEMGTGKTKVTIDQAAKLFDEGKIDCILVAAPDGVHRNWITDEVPIHLPDRILEKAKLFAYQTDKAATKWHQEICDKIISHPGLIVVAMSYDACTTEPLYERDKATGRRHMMWRGGKRFLWDVLSGRKCMFVSDESRRIKNPTADRTKVIVKAAPYAPYRRLLNGTPVPNGPFDLYSQMKFLDQNFWLPHGISTYSAFKNMFGEFKKEHVRGAGGKLIEFDSLVNYRNLDLLQTILKTICTRVTKEDVLNLPPKLYSRVPFEMTASQWKIYRQLRDEYLTWLESGELVTAPLAITRLLRFQQVTSGFLPVDDDAEPIRMIGKENPRLDLVRSIAEDIPHKTIWWTRFNRTTDEVMDILRKLGRKPVRYDGQVSSDGREEAKHAFQKGDAMDFVAKASTAGEGLTLHAAKTVVYVENTFDLAARLQSEDRAHRIGQEFPVSYRDLVALGTVDEKIVESLVDKFDIANQITGDVARAWIQ